MVRKVHLVLIKLTAMVELKADLNYPPPTHTHTQTHNLGPQACSTNALPIHYISSLLFMVK